MLMITNLIEPRMGKLILSHLIVNNCPEFRNGLLDSYFFKLTLGSDCLELWFSRVALKTILTQQCYKNLSRFQTRALSTIWYHILSLNLTSISFLLNLGFVCLSLKITVQNAKASALLVALKTVLLMIGLLFAFKYLFFRGPQISSALLQTFKQSSKDLDSWDHCIPCVSSKIICR